MLKLSRATFLAAMLGLLSAPAQSGLLAELYGQALKSEPNWLAAIAEHQAARQQAPLLRSAMLPNIQAEGSYGRIRDETGSTQNPGYQRDTIYANSWQYDIAIEQPLFDWAALAKLRQVDQALAAAQLDLVLARMDLLDTMLQRYFVWLGAYDDLGLARKQNQAVAEQLRETRVRAETGYATDAELQQLIAEQDAAQADVLDAAARLRAAREGVLQLTGAAPALPKEITGQVITELPQPADPAHWVERALAENRSLQQMQLNISRAQQELQVEKAAGYPRVSLRVEQKWLNTEEFQLGREAEVSSAVLQLKLPLYAGGAISAKVDAARYQLDALHARFEARRRAVVREARNAYDGVVTGIQRLQAKRQAVHSSEAALQAVRGAWESGLQTGAELILARRNLFQAERDEAAARYKFLLSRVALLRAVGALQDQDLLDLDALIATAS